MSRAVNICFFACCGVLFSCSTQKRICPAYQSAFIYDRPSQKEAFVYYNANKSQAREVLASNSKTLTLPMNDSTWEKSIVLPGPALPKERKTKKTRYLLLPKKTYKKALRALQTVEMKPVYPKLVTDSVDIKKALDSAARSITDTLSANAITAAGQAEEKDSTYVISIEKEKFNVDQDNYMWYFRKTLVLPDVRIALEGATEETATPKKSGAKGGFFKNLFKKKDKSAKAPAKEEQVDQPSDSVGVNTETPQTVKKKKGVFGFMKRKSKEASAPKAEPKKEEEEKF